MMKDHFTHYVQASVTSNETAYAMVKPLYDKYLLIFRFPQHLMSNQVAVFMGNVINKVCTSPYPNRQINRVHQTLVNM